MLFRLLLILILPVVCSFSPSFAQPCKGRPVIMVHGFLGAGDNYAPMAAAMQAKGYCSPYLQAFDWNTLDRGANEISHLDSLIQAVCKATGAAQVDLVAHSAGGGLAYRYLSDSSHRTRVAHYVHIGSQPMSAVAGGKLSVPMLNIYSKKDGVVKGADIPGATNLAFANYDHFGLVTADSTIQAIIQFFQEGKNIKNLKQKPQKEKSITLKALQLGTNQPEANASITWQLVDEKGTLLLPVGTGKTNAKGMINLDGIPSVKPYWITCTPEKGRPVAYYFNHIPKGPLPGYLHTLPSGGMVSLLLGGIPKSAETAAWVLFSSQAAINPEKDFLKLNNDTLSTAKLTPAAKTVVALFLYDNGKKQNSMETHPAFKQAPFMNGIDYLLPSNGSSALLEWNKKMMKIPVVSSNKFITIVVLD